MPRLTSQCVAKIMDTVDIERVVQQFTDIGTHRGKKNFAICPFHGERTPSFHINPGSNLWYCFSCHEGGDAVSFLMKKGMDYPEAMKWLADLYSIPLEYDKSEWSEAEEKAEKHRETLSITLDNLQRFFVSQFLADNPLASKARQYAFGRWGEEFCMEAGIGYAPPSAIFMQWVNDKKSMVDKDALIELGYISTNDSGDQYAFLRDRVTIPVRNRTNRLLGFTARRMDGISDFKYMNSRDSLLFKKKEIVYGLSSAIHQARRMGQMFLVEGAPDVLRLQSIGIHNVVAALGTAWGTEHFSQIKRVCNSVCFIPDSDPPKEGERFGPGFKAVFAAGEIAMQLGMEVTVREIPATDEKQDPDSYITSREVLNTIDEEKFIVWYARKLFKTSKPTPKEESEAVQTISRLVALVDVKSVREGIVISLPGIFGTKHLWNMAIKEAGIKRKDAMEKQSMARLSAKDVARRRSGIFEENNMYFIEGKDGTPIRITNFVLQPQFHIRMFSTAKRTFVCVNEFGDREAIELEQDELVSPQKFMTRIESLGNFVWLGKPEHLAQLREYLYFDMSSCYLVDKMGWNEEFGFYAFGNGVFDGERFIEADELGMVAFEGKNFYLPAFSKMHLKNKCFEYERGFIHKPTTNITLHDYVGKVMSVFGDEAMMSFAFTLAALFRDLIYPIKDAFPLLNLFGPPSSGKTAHGLAMAALFAPAKEPPKLTQATAFTINETLSRAVNSVAIYDEYKNALDEYKIEMLKAVWGGKGQSKRNNETKKSEETYYWVSMIFCGQEIPTKDPALFNRVIYLTHPRTEFSYEEKKRYSELKDMTHERLSNLLLELLKLRPVIERNVRDTFYKVQEEMLSRLNGKAINDRMLDNWITPVAAFRCVETLIDVPFSYRQLFDFAIKGVQAQNDLVKKKSELADFWTMFKTNFMNSRIKEGAHFRIVTETQFKPDSKGKPRNFGDQHPVIYIMLDTTLSVLANRQAMSVNATKLDFNSLVSFLELSPHFLGKKQYRFDKLTPQGDYEMIFVEKNGRSIGKRLNARGTAHCFDYAEIKAAYDIDLEATAMSEAEARASVINEAEAQQPELKQQPTIFDTATDEELPF